MVARSHVERARRGWRGPLHAGTLDLHHAVEATWLGQEMVRGRPSRRVYVCWLSIKLSLQRALADRLPAPVRRGGRYRADLYALGAEPVDVPAVTRFGARLAEEPEIVGATYVLVGGELMGGRQIARMLERESPDLPRAWCTWDDADLRPAMALLQEMRERADCILPARLAFAALLDACDELQHVQVP